MKKLFAALLVLLVTATSASATLYPRNTQFAELKDGLYGTIDFDYFDFDRAPGAGRGDLDVITLPKIDLRYTFDERYRIGLNIPMLWAGFETAGAADSSAFGFGKLGLTTEFKLANNFNFFFNQEFPTTHNSLLASNQAAGFDSYSFTTGFNWQKSVTDNLTWFAEYGYRYDDFDGAGSAGSFLYNNALVWDTGTWLNPSLELTGISTYGNEARKTDLRIIPGWITALNDEQTSQLRIGLPIGLNTDTPNIGVQAGLYFEM